MIGATMWELITATSLAKGPVRDDVLRDDGRYVPISHHGYKGNKKKMTRATTLSGVRFRHARHYSPYLRDVVRACLNWDQRHRPSLTELRDVCFGELDREGTEGVLRDWEEIKPFISEHADVFREGEMWDPNGEIVVHHSDEEEMQYDEDDALYEEEREREELERKIKKREKKKKEKEVSKEGDGKEKGAEQGSEAGKSQKGGLRALLGF
jgi:hypothetical protein